MARNFEIDIDGEIYAGTTAPAKSQAEALHVAMRTGIIAHFKGEPSDMTLAAMFASLDYDDFGKLVRLLVKDCVKSEEDSIPIGENLFQDDIQNYYLLVGRVVKENLGPFWNLRRQTEATEKAATETS